MSLKGTQQPDPVVDACGVHGDEEVHGHGVDAAGNLRLLSGWEGAAAFFEESRTKKSRLPAFFGFLNEKGRQPAFFSFSPAFF